MSVAGRVGGRGWLVSVVAAYLVLVTNGAAQSAGSELPGDSLVAATSARVEAVGLVAPEDLASRAQSVCSAVSAPAATDEEVAARIMAGSVRLGPFPEWELPDHPSWQEDPFGDGLWVSRYHDLEWMEPLRRVGAKSGNPQLLQRWETLLRDHLQAVSRSSWGESGAWGDLVVGVRALVTVCGLAQLGQQPWLIEALSSQGRFLASNRVYRGENNHSLFQNNGLLAVGYVLGNKRWEALAQRRADDLARKAIDPQGVTNEGSMGYQLNNFWWWSKARAIFAATKTPEPKQLRYLSRMPDVVAYATTPDRHLEMIGDTVWMRPNYVPGTISEYAATGGAAGPRPTKTLAVLRRGYIFGRSGWGEQRGFDQESFFSALFGGRGKGHGNADKGSVTFASDGAQLLWDQGYHRSSGLKMRQYLRSATAHNRVTAADGRSFMGEIAELLLVRETGRYVFFRIRMTDIPGAVWTRDVLFSKRGRYLVIDDRVQGKARTPHTYVQRFHLAADRHLELGADQALTSGEGTNVRLQWLGTTQQLTSVVGQVDPLLGWRGTNFLEAEPVPVVSASSRGRNARFTTVVSPVPVGGERGLLDSHRTPKSLRLQIRAESGDEIVIIRGDHLQVRQLTNR